ncbi:hypothetical protein KR054_004088, partial [Drosophila jambulina]
MQSTIQGCLTALAHSQISTDNWDCLLVFLCASKLPKVTLSLWEQSLTSKSDIPAWEEMNTFLSERYRTLEAIDDMRPTSAIPKKLQSFETKVSTKPRGCDLCSKEHHPIQLCPRFLNMSIEARSGYIKKKQLCLNCFARGHQLRDCTSTHSCFTCKGRDHTLLHRGNTSSENAGSSTASSPTQKSSRPSSRNASASTSTVQNYFASGTSAVLLRTAVVDVCHLGTNYRARALIDPGSEATFVSERLFKLIKLPFRNVQTQVSGLNQSVSAKSTRLCHFSIHSPNKPDLHFYKSRKIDMLIGAESFFELLAVGQIRQGPDYPTLQKTLLGWVVSGRYKSAVPKQVVNSLSCSEEPLISIDNTLQKFWSLEELPSPKKILSPEHKLCEDHYRKTTQVLPSGRFEVRLPFKSDPNGLGNSFETSSQVALNDILVVGPTIQEELYSTLLRFRLHRYALTADVKKM